MTGFFKVTWGSRGINKAGAEEWIKGQQGGRHLSLSQTGKFSFQECTPAIFVPCGISPPYFLSTHKHKQELEMRCRWRRGAAIFNGSCSASSRSLCPSPRPLLLSLTQSSNPGLKPVLDTVVGLGDTRSSFLRHRGSQTNDLNPHSQLHHGLLTCDSVLSQYKNTGGAGWLHQEREYRCNSHQAVEYYPRLPGKLRRHEFTHITDLPQRVNPNLVTLFGALSVMPF